MAQDRASTLRAAGGGGLAFIAHDRNYRPPIMNPIVAMTSSAMAPSMPKLNIKLAILLSLTVNAEVALEDTAQAYAAGADQEQLRCRRAC